MQHNIYYLLYLKAALKSRQQYFFSLALLYLKLALESRQQYFFSLAMLYLKVALECRQHYMFSIAVIYLKLRLSYKLELCHMLTLKSFFLCRFSIFSISYTASSNKIKTVD